MRSSDAGGMKRVSGLVQYLHTAATVPCARRKGVQAFMDTLHGSDALSDEKRARFGIEIFRKCTANSRRYPTGFGSLDEAFCVCPIINFALVKA